MGRGREKEAARENRRKTKREAAEESREGGSERSCRIVEDREGMRVRRSNLQSR